MENKIETLCKQKEQELLNKYFGDLTKEAAHEQPETIGNYSKDLPLQIESEYRQYLEKLWEEYASAKSQKVPLVLEEQKLREIMTDGHRERIEDAYKNAKERTLWERITRSNHEDVTFYKGLLYDYTKELLTIMRIDFLEEITGNHITGKTFEG